MKIYAIIVLYRPNISIVREQYHCIKGRVDGIIYVHNGTDGQDIHTIVNGDNVTFIKNELNYGLAFAQNQGIKASKALGAEYIILLDQDSIPSDDFVNNLQSIYVKSSKEKKVALVGPVIRNRRDITLPKENCGIIIKGIRIREIPIGEITSVSLSISSGSFIPLSVFDDVGLMEEKMFIDGVDTEWCLRAKSKGYEIIKTSTAVLFHTIGDGTKRRIKSHGADREYYIMRNSIWLMKRKYVPLGYRIRKLIMLFGRMTQSLFNMDVQYLKSDLKGVRDGIGL